MPPRIPPPRSHSSLFFRAAPRYYARRCYSTADPSSVVKITSLPAPHAGSIRIVSLNRPKARNAISRQLLAELGRATQDIHNENGEGPTRVMILASEVDSCFCAGADLKERAGFTQSETAAFLSSLRNTLTQISQLRIPTISAVSSVAFGGGLELALSTDLRVFTSNAVVSLPETRLGIIPGAGGTYRLPGLIGMNRARDMIMTGRRVSGAEAYFLGLCDRLVEVTPENLAKEGHPRGLALTEAVRLAGEICEGAPIAVRTAKRAVQGWQGGEEVENRCYDEVVRTEDRNEALAAFAEKRKPSFKGK